MGNGVTELDVVRPLSVVLTVLLSAALMAPELTSVYVLSASTDRAQPTALASMVGVDGAGSSAARGAGEVALSQLVELILRARIRAF